MLSALAARHRWSRCGARCSGSRWPATIMLGLIREGLAVRQKQLKCCPRLSLHLGRGVASPVAFSSKHAGRSVADWSKSRHATQPRRNHRTAPTRASKPHHGRDCPCFTPSGLDRLPASCARRARARKRLPKVNGSHPGGARRVGVRAVATDRSGAPRVHDRRGSQESVGAPTWAAPGDDPERLV